MAQMPIIHHDRQTLFDCDGVDDLVELVVGRHMETRVFAMTPVEVWCCVHELGDVDVWWDWSKAWLEKQLGRTHLCNFILDTASEEAEMAGEMRLLGILGFRCLKSGRGPQALMGQKLTHTLKREILGWGSGPRHQFQKSRYFAHLNFNAEQCQMSQGGE